MKRQSKRRIKSKVLLQYLISYTGIVVLSCALVGTILFCIALENLKDIYYKTGESHVEIMIDDFSDQMKDLLSIANTMSDQSIFSVNVIASDKYNNYVVTQEIKKYQGLSSYSSNFFILYPDNELIYNVEGSTRPFSLYCEAYGIAEEILREQIESSGTQQILQLSGTDFLIVCPLAENNYIKLPTAAVCFQITSDMVEERFTNIIGEKIGDIEFVYQNITVLQLEEAYSGSDIVEYRVEDKMKLVYNLDLGDKMNFMSGYPVILVIIAILLLFSMACTLALITYKPVRKISNQLFKGNSDDNMHMYNEFSQIEDATKIAQKHMKSQRHLLTSEALTRLIRGGASLQVRRLLESIGSPITNQSMVVICVHSNSDLEFTIVEHIQEELEDFTYDTGVVYTYAQSANRIYILVTDEDESKLSDTIEMLYETVNLQMDDYVIRTSLIKHDISEIQEAAFEASQACYEENKNKNENRYIEKSNYSYVNEISMVISKGNREEACSILEKLLQSYNENHPNEMGKAYIFAEITIYMVQICKTYNVELKEEKVSYLLSIQNEEAFIKQIILLIDRCCDSVCNKKISVEKENIKEIVEYIDAHYFEYDMGLETLSEKFHMNTCILSGRFKEYTGQYYKDYIIEKRIEEAKTILRTEDLTINEVCNKVGYINVSHFIRNFKKITNVTPLVYKKNWNTNLGK